MTQNKPKVYEVVEELQVVELEQKPIKVFEQFYSDIELIFQKINRRKTRKNVA